MRLSLAALCACAMLASACRKDEVVEPDPAPAPTPPPPPETIPGRDDNIALGNPSGAVASVVMANNYLLVHPQYVVGYDNSRGLARWVSWHLSLAWKGTAERCGCFQCGSRFAPAAITEWVRAEGRVDASGYPITPEFLQAMHESWFG